MTQLEKNQTVTVTIDDLTYEGLGVAHIERFPLFIENALPGEEAEVLVVKVGKKFGYGKVLKLLKESPDRVPSADQNLLRSGIAPLSHLTYAKQLAFKQTQVEKVMQKVAQLPDVPVLPTIGMADPIGYRNKAQIPVRRVNGEIMTGFYRKNSHDLLPIENYLIQDPAIDQAIIVIRDILRRFNLKTYNEVDNTGLLRHLIVRRGHYSHEMMVVLVTRTEKFFKGEEIAKEIQKALPEVVSVMQNVNPEKTNVILGKLTKKLAGKETIEDQLLGKTYQISAESFYQINTEQAEKLYQTAIDFAKLTKENVVIDAYSGIGTIALSLADQVKHVYGMDVVKSAVADAQQNAERNHVENATFEVSKAEIVMPRWNKVGIKADVIVVDPPRKGLAESFITASVEVTPEKIIYISCNPATLARDLKLYQELGYTTEKIQPVDLFPQTTHVEAVALLKKAVD